ncbi:MAG TPA: hypothetical protein VK503_03100 [Candidatus Bathyarchaeia archaeon]|nr:hypothetical protein [Candidatus Bathyarchaeia archaeon]
MPKKISKKKSRHSKGDFVLVLLILVVLVSAYAYVQRPSSTSMSSTSYSYVSLQAADFNLTYSYGCLVSDPTNASDVSEHFTVIVSNRWNEIVHYLNASIYVANIQFSTGQGAFGTLPLIRAANATNSTTLMFDVNFPISRSAFGRAYVLSALLAVIIYIRQDSQVVRYVVLPNIPVSSSVPSCSTWAFVRTETSMSRVGQRTSLASQKSD